jgi:hypothetical protein
MKIRTLYRSDGQTSLPLPAAKKAAIEWLEALPDETLVKVTVRNQSSIGHKRSFLGYVAVEHTKEDQSRIKAEALRESGLFVTTAEVVP